MPVSGSVPTPTADGATGGSDDPQELATWRRSHEVRALRDTIALYRECAAALARRNAELQEEIDDLAASLHPPLPRPASRGRDQCRR